MSTRREALPSSSAAERQPLPGSRKVYVAGPHGMRVPFREIALSPTRGAGGQSELNPPLRVYDTSGPYTDPSATIDLYAGLPELRLPWILARGEYDRSEPSRQSAPDLALTRQPQRAPRTRQRHADALRAQGQDHARDGVHRAPRGLRARVRARRSRARPRDHPRQHQPPRDASR